MKASFFALILFLSLCNYSYSFFCPIGSSSWQQQCYTFFNTTKERQPAEEVCIALGGHLTAIHDGFANSFIAQEATKHLKGESFWIGAEKTVNSSIWSWSDGTLMDFMDWERNDTHNASRIDCAVFVISAGQWSSQFCVQQKPYICQTPAFHDSPSTSEKPASCEEGWLYFAPSNACYLEFNQDAVETWEPAEAICVEHGGHLASLHSQEEALFILPYEEETNLAFWIGLETSDMGYTWQWTDGTPLDYMPWGSGFPYHDFSETSCGLLMSDNNRTTPVYENLECSFSQAFMCKKPL